MYWAQGESDSEMPLLNRLCIERWKLLNQNNWEIHIITNANAKDFIPEFNAYLSTENKTHAAKSDLLRLLLLFRFGGVWVDCSVYPTLPLDYFIHNIVTNNQPFFAYRFSPVWLDNQRGHRITTSWFIVITTPTHFLIEAWKTEFLRRFIFDKNWKYFTIHDSLFYLYSAKNKNIKQIIDGMVFIDQKIPHSASFSNDNILPSFMYKRPLEENICKLTSPQSI